MNTHFTDILDIALQRQTNSEPIHDILSDFPQQAEALAPLLEAAHALNAAQPVIVPEVDVLQVERTNFLNLVEQTLPVPAPQGFFTRLNRWASHQFPWILSTNQKREPNRMNALILKAALVLTLIFGSMGGTAVLAQESLPDSPLYSAKIALEDVRLAFNQDMAEETVLHFSFAEERAQEMVAMAAAGNTPDDAVQLRLEEHMNAALNHAAQQPDETMFKLLTQAQNMVQTQLQNIADVTPSAGEPAQKMLGEAGGFLNRAGQEIESGLQTPQTFRARFGNSPEGVVPQETGPCNTGDCEPAGDANKFGQDPENAGHNGTCDGEDCEPVGDQHQYGQDPENDGQNGPGDGECVSEDCNQYRYQYGLEDLPLEPPNYQHRNLLGGGDGCSNGDCVPGGHDVNHGDGNNGDGNNGDGNNGDGNNGGGNGDGNNGDGNNGGSGGNGGGNGGGN